MGASIIIAGAFAIHGLTMAGLGVRLPWSIGAGRDDSIGPSWLLGGGALAVVVGLVTWLLAGSGFIAAAVGFWFGLDWWPLTALVGAGFTLLAIGLWAGSVPTGAYAGAALAAGTIVFVLLRS